MDVEEAGQRHNSAFHKRTDEVEEDCFEVFCQKEKIVFDLPMVVGLSVYNNAKLHVLKFIYEVLFVFFHRSDFLFLESDTDSAYLALSAETLEELVIPEKAAQFQEVREKWFVTDPSQNRTPGLLKVEKTADKFLGLCSKTYICISNNGEVSVKAKGVQQGKNSAHILTWINFLNILFGRPDAEYGAFNVGIRSVGNFVRGYVQEKRGLTRLYCKRISLSDGRTLPLKL